MNCTKNLWAPLVVGGRKPWIVWTAIRSTRRDAKAAYLEGFDATSHKNMLKRVKFVRVYVAAHGSMSVPDGKGDA